MLLTDKLLGALTSTAILSWELHGNLYHKLLSGTSRLSEMTYLSMSSPILKNISSKLYTQIHSVPHRKHITSPIQRTTGLCYLRKQPLFIVRTIRNTQIQFVPQRKNITSPLQRPTG
jgi:hypothetical protein